MEKGLDEQLIEFEKDIGEISTTQIAKLSEEMRDDISSINSFERNICFKISETTKFAILLNNETLKEELSKSYNGINIYKLKNEDGTINKTFAIDERGLCFKEYHQPYSHSFSRADLNLIVNTQKLEDIICNKLDNKDLFIALKSINELLDKKLLPSKDYRKAITINLNKTEEKLISLNKKENETLTLDITNITLFINSWRTYNLNSINMNDLKEIKFLLIYKNHKKEIDAEIKKTHELIKRDLAKLKTIEEEIINKCLSKWLILSRMEEEQ